MENGRAKKKPMNSVSPYGGQAKGELPSPDPFVQDLIAFLREEPSGLTSQLSHWQHLNLREDIVKP
jgi:hypothetical protein